MMVERCPVDMRGDILLFEIEAHVAPTKRPGVADMALARAQPDEKPGSMQSGPVLKLPTLLSPIFTGVRSFVRVNNRSRTETNATMARSATVDSVIDGDEVDYHATLMIRMQAALAKSQMV